MSRSGDVQHVWIVRGAGYELTELERALALADEVRGQRQDRERDPDGNDDDERELVDG